MRWRLLLGVVVVLLIQETVIPQIEIAGVYPDLVAGYVAVAGLVCGPTEGCVVGFLAGMGEDLFLRGPFGMSALVYTMVGYAAGTLFVSTGMKSSRLGISVVSAIGSASSLAGYALVGALLGQSSMVTSGLGGDIAIVAAVNFFAGVPLAAIARRASRPRRGAGAATGQAVRA